MGTEVEVLEFLSYLVGMTKPMVAVETGTYKGYGTMWIARGLARNAWGQLHTAEPVARLCEEAKKLYASHRSWPQDNVTFWKNTGRDMIDQIGRVSKIDFAFLDSNLDSRLDEMIVLNRYMTDNCIVAVHDTSKYHDQPGHNGPRTPFLEYAKHHGMQAINFDTPRGLMLLRKAPK